MTKCLNGELQIGDTVVSLPCEEYGGLIGPSALSSMEDPCTKAPAAMMTSLSYPGIAHGSGVT